MNNNTYNYHIKGFNEFRGDRPLTVKLAWEYRRHLIKTCLREGTMRVRWAAARDLYDRESELSRYRLVTQFAWLYDQVPFPACKTVGIYRLTEPEFQRMCMAASERDRLMFQVCRLLDLKVSELTSLRPHDRRVPEDIRERCFTVFGSHHWLFETSAGRQYSRSYVSQRVRTYARRLFGKTASAESLRPPYTEGSEGAA